MGLRRFIRKVGKKIKSVVTKPLQMLGGKGQKGGGGGGDEGEPRAAAAQLMKRQAGIGQLSTVHKEE